MTSAGAIARTWVRIDAGDGARAWAEIDGDEAALLDRAPWEEGAIRTGRRVAAAVARRLCPVVPTKIVCVGRNYAAHARELGHDLPAEPLLFLKPPSALIGPDDAIVLPPDSDRVEHEAELGVVVGRAARNVSEADALRHVLGYTCVCDVTARDLQKKDGQWTRGKGFDTFCPAGPAIVSALPGDGVSVRCRVNGAIRQDGQTRDMIFPVARVVAYASRIMTLEPGDLIATGTPEGVGPIAAGDVVEVEIGGVGTLTVRVRS